jgi:hypothetical protein
VQATVSARTSLRVSTDVLDFGLVAPGRPATASVEFSAGARTAAGAEVMMSVETLAAAEGGDMASWDLSFAGRGEGTTRGDISESGPTVAGRWIGSGLRRGRVVFVLVASTEGVFRVPVRFLLSAP